jgi:hypothetical protein
MQTEWDLDPAETDRQAFLRAEAWVQANYLDPEELREVVRRWTVQSWKRWLP